MEAATAATGPAARQDDDGGGSSLKWLLLAVLAAVFIGFIGLFAALGSEGQNQEFQPQNEYRLTPWVELKLGGLDLSINRAVFFLILTSIITTAALVWIAKRMEAKPDRVQTAVEAMYDLTANQITRGNLDRSMAAKWFPFIATLFFFIWVANLIGYVPLPTNSEHPIDVFGLSIPSAGIYGATTNISVPLALTIVVWFSYHIEGVRTHGVRGYLKTWVPSGVGGVAAVPIFIIEVISHFVRLISLSVRLFANILAGHLLILFMGGGLSVLLGVAAVGLLTVPVATVFFVFEIVLIATLQAFIFATLTAIYLGGATGEGH